MATEFETLAQRHRRELHVHCYRMLGSFDEAEDAVQETLLRAWRGRSQIAGGVGGGGFRAWLYRIATNYCLDVMRRRKRRPVTVDSFAEIPWLTPYPDRLLDEIPAEGGAPDAVAVARETIELAFIAIVQELPARQRAALLLCDVMGFSPPETAQLLECSVPAVNSALQRARATLAKRRPAAAPADPAPPAPPPTPRERDLVQMLIDIHEGADAQRAAQMLAEDVRVTMPPNPWLYEGREAVLTLFEFGTGYNGPGEWRLVRTAANRQPATASYLRACDDSEFRAFKLDVFDIRDGLVAEITTFGSALFEAFGLPATWEAPSARVA